jgi:hypothetical protein
LLFQKYILKKSSILEIRAEYSEFFNPIQAKNKIVLDVNPDVRLHAQKGVQIVIGDLPVWRILKMKVLTEYLQMIYFKHIKKPDLIQALCEVHQVLKSEEEFLVFQPNIRYCAKDYWMFFDHITPLDNRSIADALEISDFYVKECIPRFLPYTTKRKLPKSLMGFRNYLKSPILWRLFVAPASIRAGKG